MRAVRAHCRLTSWIAAVAILLASLAPALSHALASATGSNWTEICTAQGSKWIQAGEDGSERTPASAHVLEHCGSLVFVQGLDGALGSRPAFIAADRSG